MRKHNTDPSNGADWQADFYASLQEQAVIVAVVGGQKLSGTLIGVDIYDIPHPAGYGFGIVDRQRSNRLCASWNVNDCAARADGGMRLRYPIAEPSPGCVQVSPAVGSCARGVVLAVCIGV